MIWFFERKGSHLRCEVRRQQMGDCFELVITEPDGSERIESFADSTALNRRSAQLEQEWRRSGWDGPFARDL